MYVVLCLIVFGCQYQCNWLPGKSRLWNDLLCVEWDVKPYTLTQTERLPTCLSMFAVMKSTLLKLSENFSAVTKNLTFGSRAFWFSTPRVSNSLPVSVREFRSLPSFRRHLKTYFQSACPFQLPALPRIYLHPCALILLRLWRYISHLLTYLQHSRLSHEHTGANSLDWVTAIVEKISKNFSSWILFTLPLSSARQHPSYGDHLEVKMEYYQNYSVLDCVIQCSHSAAHLYEQFLQVQQIGFVTLGPLRCV